MRFTGLGVHSERRLGSGDWTLKLHFPQSFLGKIGKPHDSFCCNEDFLRIVYIVVSDFEVTQICIAMIALADASLRWPQRLNV